MILHNPISFLLGEKETASALKTCQRERERERLSSLNTCQRENHVSPLKGRVLGGTLGVLVTLAALVVLVACPAASSGGGGTGYVCTNGSASSLRDATADGLTRCASCDLLYRLDGTTDVVGTSCEQVAVGEATRIGMVTEFGVGETGSFGLAAIDNTLYMVGLQADFLYTLNIDPDDSTPDGMAIQVGSLSAGFGVGETAPTGLAAIGNTLYMVGIVNGVLYTLNIDPDDGTDDGRAMQVGGLSAGFGVSERFPSGLAAIDATLYMVGQTANALYTLNIDPADGTADDGMAAQVGSTPAGFGEGEDQVNDLAAIGTTLYMVGERTDVLYTLNTTTGMATQVGSAANFGVSENNPTGLAAISNTLYMVGTGGDALYAIRYQ